MVYHNAKDEMNNGIIIFHVAHIGQVLQHFEDSDELQVGRIVHR
jgi:hypothetical protein